MPLLLIAFIFFSGLSFCFGFVNGLSGALDLRASGSSSDRAVLWFGVLCLLLSIFIAVDAGIFLSDDIALTAILYRLLGLLNALLLALLPAFGAAFSSRRLDRFDLALMISWAGIGLWSLFTPTGPWLARIDFLHVIDAGPPVLYSPRGPFSLPGWILMTALQIPLLARQFMDGLSAARKGQKVDGLLWAVLVALIALSLLHDKFVFFGLLPQPFSGGIVLPLGALVMAARLALRKDISRRELERARKESIAANARFREIFEHSGDALFIHDAKSGRILESNRTMRQMYGYPLGGDVEVALKDLSAEEQGCDQEAALAKLKEAVEKGRTSFPWIARRRDGSTFPADVSLKRISLDGRDCVLASVRETTERERALEELRGEKAFTETLLAGLPGVFYLLDDRFRLIEWNRALEESTGFDAKVLKGKSILDNYRDPVERMAAESFLIGALEGNRERTTIDLPLYRRDRSRVPYLFTAIRLDTERGSLVMGVGVDMSERVKAERAAREGEERLRQIQRLESMAQLAAGVAHDFNNLLSPIMGYSSILLDRLQGDDQARDGLSRILAAAGKAQGLTRRLLALGSPEEAGNGAVEAKAVLDGMGSILRSLLREDIAFALDPGPAGEWVALEATQLEQIVMNLAINARDAMPSGGSFSIQVAKRSADQAFLARHPECKPGDYLSLEAADTGAGMEESVKERVFEPFFTTKEEGKGTGLGLTTVFSLSRAAGGAVEVESEPGKGSRFTVFLPLSARRGGAPRGAEEPAPQRAQTGPSLILLCEDDDSVRNFVRRALKSFGYEVLAASHPDEALSLAAASAVGGKKPELLLTDVIMPGMNGRELWERMAATHPQMRVLFMSGYPGDALEGLGGLSGQPPLLRKPFTPRELEEAILGAMAPDPGD